MTISSIDALPESLDNGLENCRVRKRKFRCKWRCRVHIRCGPYSLACGPRAHLAPFGAIFYEIRRPFKLALT